MDSQSILNLHIYLVQYFFICDSNPYILIPNPHRFSYFYYEYYQDVSLSNIRCHLYQ
jgi:hypothetical protein